jgi:hypothetical protein
MKDFSTTFLQLFDNGHFPAKKILVGACFTLFRRKFGAWEVR